MTTNPPLEPDYRELLAQLRLRTAANRFATSQRRQLQQLSQRIKQES